MAIGSTGYAVVPRWLSLAVCTAVLTSRSRHDATTSIRTAPIYGGGDLVVTKSPEY